MTGIPYNYGKYIDDTVKLKDQGFVDAGKQVKSPASAGSRGLNKTTQFTKDKTQMQMGNSPIAESMVEIRNILNRIDGVNVPVQEKRDNSDIDIRKLLVDISSMKDRIAELAIGDDAKTSAFTALAQVEDDIAQEIKGKFPEAAKEDDGDERAIAAMKLAKDENRKEGFDYPQGGKYGYKAERGSGTGAMGTMQVNVTIHDRETDETMHIKDMNYLELEKGDEQETLAMIWDENRDLIQKESADSDELSRLKELSGIEEDAELTDEQEKGLEAIAKKYKDREGGNGDELARGHIKALTSSGITTDGFDVEEMEAYAKKIGKDWPEWEDEIDDFLKQAPITSGMIDDMIKVLGPDWEQNEKLSAAAADVLDKSAGFVPMPEADEFNIEDDEDFEEVLGPLGFPEDETELFDAEYRGRKVPLNKPMRGDVKKFKVYVKDPKTGNVKKVNFGHGGTSAKRKTMRIRKSNPKARKSFRARHNCANPGPKTKARYWSCRKW